MSETLNPDFEPVVSLDSLLDGDAVPVVRSLPVARAGISIEVIAYIALVLLALVFRVAEIDSVPLSDLEATRALPAWHTAFPDAPGTIVPAASSVNFWLQYASFVTLGGNELSARLPGVIGGIVLVLLPLLFRQRLGRERTFILSLLLAFSPIALVAARTADPATWTMIFALAALWAFGRYYDMRRKFDIGLTAAFAGAAIFLAEPGGIVLAIIIGLSVWAALWWTAWSAPQDLALENPGSNVLARARSIFAEVPWLLCLSVAAVVVFSASTLFMLHPAGLGMVGEVVGGFLRGFWTPAQPNAPVGYPVLTLLLFDPLLLCFGIAGIVLLLNRDRFGLRERFLTAWFVIGLVVLTLYRGGSPAHALFLALPLIGLAVEAIVELVSYRPVMLFLFEDLMPDDEGNLNQRYVWVKYLAGLVSVALLVMLAVHFQEIGRGLVSLPAGMPFNDAFNMMMDQPFAMFRYSVIWFVISLLFLLIGYMMAASIWGNQNTLQGLGIGALVFMLVSGVGGAWNESVLLATKPGSLWYTSAVTKDVPLLRKTLFELAMRNTRGFPELMNVTVLVNEETGITDNGLMAWIVRDYPLARFVTTLEDAQQDEIVLMPPVDVSLDPPNLGGTYVGQSFALRKDWTLAFLTPQDFPAWFALRRIRDVGLVQDKVVLWVRQDIFDASPVGQID